MAQRDFFIVETTVHRYSREDREAWRRGLMAALGALVAVVCVFGLIKVVVG